MSTAVRPASAVAEGSSVVQLVVFHLDGRECALPVEQVREVLRMVAIAPVPESPDWVPGVINLRGRVVPVIDLRARLGLPPAEPALNTPVIVAETDGRMVGLIADTVADFLTLPSEALSPPEATGSTPRSVSAVARSGDRLILLFDLARLRAGAEHLVPQQ